MDIEKYFVDETFSKTENDKWLTLVDYAFAKADAVEFNILYSDSELQKLLVSLQDDLIDRGSRKNKIYASGQYIRFKLSERLKTFIKSKEYNSWRNYILEDISFLSGTTEILATITHENYIFLLLTDLQADSFNRQGFSFGNPFTIKSITDDK